MSVNVGLMLTLANTKSLIGYLTGFIGIRCAQPSFGVIAEVLRLPYSATCMPVKACRPSAEVYPGHGGNV